MTNGAYFHATRPTFLDGCTDHFVGAEIVGWRVAYRQGTPRPDWSPPLQRRKFDNPSRFGVLREIVRRGRAWSGKVHFLEIVECRPIYQAHYETRFQEDEA